MMIVGTITTILVYDQNILLLYYYMYHYLHHYCHDHYQDYNIYIYIVENMEILLCPYHCCCHYHL